MIIKAVGEKLSSIVAETTIDQDLLPSLDNYYTNKYNSRDNFKQHKLHPLSGVKFNRRGATLRQPQTLLYQKSLKNFITNSMRNLPKSFCSFGNLFIHFFSFNIIAIQQQKNQNISKGMLCLGR
ncbi:hypothetical protein [Campylobacter sp. JMF_03 NE3]|uniref:hypothetical protein n=1 Tax=Campylobacter sp. JMF_03 NE3 TaxID=2983831 RepID=UPI0022EA0EE0|nr:hypothetical protein [Campylobacter sp. JMF_03 NE3]MDA3053528.1 hypothetical protein [Campylobacter sp. JMF_03 NE3]